MYPNFQLLPTSIANYDGPYRTILLSQPVQGTKRDRERMKKDGSGEMVGMWICLLDNPLSSPFICAP